MKFLEELKGKCPFPIIEIQTDNDATFTDKFTSLAGLTGEHPFDVWCNKNGIRHKLIPVGQKELNGKIENCHKQDDREFYSQGQYYSFDQMALNMTGYSERWNTQRRTKALGFKTPHQVIYEAYVRVTAWFLFWRENAKNPPLFTIDENAVAVISLHQARLNHR